MITVLGLWHLGCVTAACCAKHFKTVGLDFDQEEIEKLENLETCCRHLKILLIQGNAILKLENLSKLKELE